MENEIARVQKWIALSGFCGRKKAEDYIAKGLVIVNNKIVSLGDHCSANDTISVGNKILHIPINDFNYIILNKPRGVITSKSDEQGRKKVLELLEKKDYKENLFPVGRLDMNTTGLLIITNNGPFAQSFLHPSNNTSKTYSVVLDKELDASHKKQLEKGIKLEEVQLCACQINKISSFRYEVILSEGKNRQIRRMFFALGYRVIGLERTHIGSLSLAKLNIKPGEYLVVSKQFLEKTIKSKKSKF